MNKSYIDLNVIWHSDETTLFNNTGVDYLLADCDERKARFFNINALAVYIDMDGKKYTEIHANGTTYYTKDSIQEVTDLIVNPGYK